jgi:hypothetical protein
VGASSELAGCAEGSSRGVPLESCLCSDTKCAVFADEDTLPFSRASRPQARLASFAARVQATSASECKVREDLKRKQAALDAFDAKHKRADGGEEVPLKTRNARAKLEDDIAAAACELQAAKAAVEPAASAVTAAEEAMLQKWDKKQLYWIKGIPATVPGVLAAVLAGVPVRAVLKLHDAKAAPPADTPPALQLFDSLIAAHKDAAFDDPVVSIAALDVASGPAGGRFVPSGHYQSAGVAAAVPVLGAAEMQGALRAIENCAGPFDRWLETRTVYAQPPSADDVGLYRKRIAGVPPEQQSIAVMLHCMLEQVDCSIKGASGQVQDSEAELEAGRLFDEALAGVLGGPLPPSKHAKPEDHEYCTVLHGDEAAMAARGVTSGHVQPRRKRALRSSCMHCGAALVLAYAFQKVQNLARLCN